MVTHTQSAPGNLDGPYLPPVERPKSLVMRFMYLMSRRTFGHVLGPLKVFAVRLPLSFGSFYGKVSSLDKKLQLPKETAFLVRERVAEINTCAFCMDIGRWFAIEKAKLDPAKFDALEQYETNPLFTEKERAALAYASELTAEKSVSPATIARLRAAYSERQICEIVWLIASEHLYNLTNVGLGLHSDNICKVPKSA